MDVFLGNEVGLSLLAMNIVLCVGLLIVVMVHRRSRIRLNKAFLAIQNDIAAVCAAALGMGQRLDALEEKTRRHAERMEQRDLSEPMRQSYRQAAQLIDSGADVQTLVDRCGVTRGEAELLANLNRMAADQASQRELKTTRAHAGH